MDRPPDASVSDLLIVERARRGNAVAFEQLVKRHQREAMVIALALTGNGQDAGDVTQEAFLTAWREIGELKDATKFRAWLGRIVRTAASRLHRRMRLTTTHDETSPPSDDAGPADRMHRKELRQEIRTALEELDELSRVIVMLRYFEEMRSKEIGELLELSPATVDMRLSRAREQLRGRLSGLEDWADDRVGSKR